MKKFIAVLMAVIIWGLSLTACEKNNTKPNSDGSAASGESAQSAEETPKLNEVYTNLKAELDKTTESGQSFLPSMIDVTNPADYGVNVDDAEDFVAKEAAISTVFVQLIIVKAKPGKAGAVNDSLKDHQSALKNTAFYPQGVEAAASSIVGNKGDYIYLICHTDSETVERELLKLL